MKLQTREFSCLLTRAIDSFKRQSSSTMSDQEIEAAIVPKSTLYKLSYSSIFKKESVSVEIDTNSPRRAPRFPHQVLTQHERELIRNLQCNAYLSLLLIIGVITVIVTVCNYNPTKPASTQLSTSSTIAFPSFPSQYINATTRKPATHRSQLRLEDVLNGTFSNPPFLGFWLHGSNNYAYVTETGTLKLDNDSMRIAMTPHRDPYMPYHLDFSNALHMEELCAGLLLIESPNTDADQGRPSQFSLHITDRKERMLTHPFIFGGLPIFNRKLVTRVDYAIVTKSCGQMAVAYRRDIYYYRAVNASGLLSHPIRLTSSVSDATHNGISNWRHGTDLWHGSPAMWFSPNGDRLAYLRFTQHAGAMPPSTSTMASRRFIDPKATPDCYSERCTFAARGERPLRHEHRRSRYSHEKPERLSSVQLHIIDTLRVRINIHRDPAQYTHHLTGLGSFVVPGAFAWASDTRFVNVWLHRKHDRVLVRMCQLKSGYKFHGVLDCYTVTFAIVFVLYDYFSDHC